jgi:hypothetical protein
MTVYAACYDVGSRSQFETLWSLTCLATVVHELPELRNIVDAQDAVAERRREVAGLHWHRIRPEPHPNRHGLRISFLKSPCRNSL